MHIVRRHQAKAHLLRKVNQSLTNIRIVTFMFLYLDEESFGPEYLEITFRRKARRFFIAVGNIKPSRKPALVNLRRF